MPSKIPSGTDPITSVQNMGKTQRMPPRKSSLVQGKKQANQTDNRVHLPKDLITNQKGREAGAGMPGLQTARIKSQSRGSLSKNSNQGNKLTRNASTNL